LEQELGATLFQRSKQGLRLTPAGESFYEDTEKILFSMMEAMERVKLLEEKRIIRVATDPFVNFKLVTTSLIRFARCRPQVELQLQSMPDDRFLDAVLQGDSDLCFTLKSKKAKEMDLLYTPIQRGRLQCMFAPGDPLAQRSELRIPDLRGRRVFLRESLAGGLLEELGKAGIEYTDLQLDEKGLPNAIAELEKGGVYFFCDLFDLLPEYPKIYLYSEALPALEMGVVCRKDPPKYIRDFLEIAKMKEEK